MPTGVDVHGGNREGAIPGAVRKGSPFYDYAPAVALLIIGLVGLSVASLSGAGREGEYLVVTAPWLSASETINLIGFAEGGLLETSRFQNIIIAASSRGDFAERARDAGAWFVLPAPKNAGCFSLSREIPRQ